MNKNTNNSNTNATNTNTNNTPNKKNASAKRDGAMCFYDLVVWFQANLGNPVREQEIQRILIDSHKNLIRKMVCLATLTKKPSEDAISNGTQCFLNGLRTYDPSQRKSPSTYLAECVKNGVRDANLRDNIFGRPAPAYNKSIIARAEKGLMGEGKNPTPTAIRAWLKAHDPEHCLSIGVIKDVLMVSNYIGSSNRSVSFSVNEEDDAAGIDFEPDPNQRQPIDNLIDLEEPERYRRYWRAIKANLSQEEYEVFRVFYNTDLSYAKTAKELGRQYTQVYRQITKIREKLQRVIDCPA